MKRILSCLLLLFFATYSSAQLTNETIDVDGVQREFLLYLPTGFDASTETLPLVIIYHGLGGNASQMTTAGFNQIADTARIIVMYPEGLPNGFGQAAWNNGTGASSSANDLGFTSKMMDLAVLQYNADNSRLYCTGFSMGSIMSYHLACNMNQRVAAIGCMAGTMATSDIANCVPTYSTPVIHLHGTADPTVPYDSNPLPTLSLVPETIDFWKNAKSCGTTADSTQIANTASDGYTTDRFVYNGCNDDESLELWRTNGAGHDYLFQPVNDLTYGIEVWLFLRKWSHSSPQAAGLEVNQEIEVGIFPNPSNGLITIETSFDFSTVELFDLSGKKVKSVRNTGNVNFDFSGVDAGYYLVKLSNGTEFVSQSIIIE